MDDQMYCVRCCVKTVFRTLPLEAVEGQAPSGPDTWLRRARLCTRCKHVMTTVEVDEDFFYQLLKTQFSVVLLLDDLNKVVTPAAKAKI
jgi:transcriptional regulator NrdR family protein